MGKKKAFQWYTIHEFADYKPLCLYHREDESEVLTDESLSNTHVLARSHFYLEKQDPPVLLYISADDYYKLYINGKFVTQGPAPGYPEHYFYNEIDITPYVEYGENVVAVHLYYQGAINRVWNSGDYRLGIAAVLCHGGEKELQWVYKKCDAYSGQWTGYRTQVLENVDLRKWESDWAEKFYPDSGWNNMVPADFGVEMNTLYLQPTSQLQIYRKVPNIIKRTEQGWFIDVGEEITGVLCFRVSGPEGETLRVQCGEELDTEGNVRYQMRCSTIYDETITCNGKMEEIVPYDYKAFRYAQIICRDNICICDIYVQIRHYPMKAENCCLHTEDPVMDEIFQMCKNAVRLGTQEGYLDCPSREKGQYLGDAVVTARSHVWLTGQTDMLRKCIEQFAFTTGFCPGMLAVAPGGKMQEIADFSLLWFQLLITDYLFTGDVTFLKKQYPVAKSIMDYFQKFEDSDGLLSDVTEKWNLVDWPDNMRDHYDFSVDKKNMQAGKHNVINALYVGAMKTISQIEMILGIGQTYDWKEKNKQFHNCFYRKDLHRYIDSPGSEHSAIHSNIYPLYFGLVEEAEEDYVADYLEERGMCCGVFMSYFYLKALARAGRYGKVYDFLVNRTEYGWYNMLKEGATACFEAWGKDQKPNTSLCHPWASAPIPVFIEEIAGLYPNPDLSEKVILKPHIPERLGSMELTVPYRNSIYSVIWDGKNIVMNQK